MMSSIHRRPALLGAVLSTQMQGAYYGTYVGPSYDLLDKLHVDVNTLIVSRSDFQTELDGLHAELQAIDNRLSTLDSADETKWTAEMQSLQNRLHEFTTKIALAKGQQSFGLTLGAAVIAFATMWAFTKRIPRFQRSVLASGTALVGAGVAQYWFRNKR